MRKMGGVRAVFGRSFAREQRSNVNGVAQGDCAQGERGGGGRRKMLNTLRPIQNIEPNFGSTYSKRVSPRVLSSHILTPHFLYCRPTTRGPNLPPKLLRVCCLAAALPPAPAMRLTVDSLGFPPCMSMAGPRFVCFEAKTCGPAGTRHRPVEASGSSRGAALASRRPHPLLA